MSSCAESWRHRDHWPARYWRTGHLPLLTAQLSGRYTYRCRRMRWSCAGRCCNSRQRRRQGYWKCRHWQGTGIAGQCLPCNLGRLTVTLRYRKTYWTMRSSLCIDSSECWRLYRSSHWSRHRSRCCTESRCLPYRATRSTAAPLCRTVWRCRTTMRCTGTEWCIRRRPASRKLCSSTRWQAVS